MKKTHLSVKTLEYKGSSILLMVCDQNVINPINRNIVRIDEFSKIMRNNPERLCKVCVSIYNKAKEARRVK